MATRFPHRTKVNAFIIKPRSDFCVDFTIMNFRQILRVLWSIGMLLHFAAAAQTASTISELSAYIQEAEDNNPAIQEARWTVEQALIKHQELLEFLDPSLYAALGHADNSKDVPGSNHYSSTTNDATELQTGVEIPFAEGFYLAIGGAERILHGREGDSHITQTLVGARVRVPLLRDRGFAELANDRALAKAEYNAAVANLLKQTQIIRRNVVLAYIAAYESQMSYKVTIEASERFRRLVDEATELERLGVIPAYQIHDARMDYQIGLENEEIARNKVELNLIALSAVLGKHREIRLQFENDDTFLVTRASETPVVPTVNLERSYEARGSYLVIENTISQVRAQILSAEEEMKDDLSLNFGAAWQAESHNRAIGTHELLGDERQGAEIALVWKRNLDNRGPRARLARYNARIQQFKQQLRAEAISIETEVRNELNNLATARQRLEIVNKGIEAAEKTLEAEQERFKLGQSTSSVVTDAQKDLTSLKQRLTSAAADLLRAWANLQYATGYDIK